MRRQRNASPEPARLPRSRDGIELVRATAADAEACIRLRGMTRENAVSEARLRAVGITAKSWAEDIATGRLPGWAARRGEQLVGYCFGAAATGEVVVLALLPEEEGAGLGKRLLQLVVEDLRRRGHARLFLGCARDPAVRSHGFYRHLGWVSTGKTDGHGDEVLELRLQGAPARPGDPRRVAASSAQQSAAPADVER